LVVDYSLLFHHHGNEGNNMLQAFKSDLQLLSRYKQLFPLSFAVFVSMLGFGLVMPLLPIYARNFGATGTQLGFLTASFAVTRTLTTFPGGWLADKAGRKKPVVTGLLVYSIVMTLYGFTQDINQLILLRALQGMASGIVWPVISTMVADITSPQDRGKAMGLYQTAWFSGNVLGPSIGGVVAGVFSLAAPFFICGVLAFVTMFLIIFTVQETAKATPEECPEESQTKLSSAPRMDATSSRGRARRLHGLTPYPGAFIGLCIVGLIISSSHSLIQPILSVFANEELGVSVANVGILFTLMGITSIITTLPMGAVSDRVGRKTTLTLGKVIDAFSAVLIIMSGSFWFLLLVMMLRGVGRGASNPSLVALFSSLMPASNRGKSMGIFNSFQNVGLVVGSTLGGFLYDAVSYQFPFIACAAISLVGIAVIFLTIREPEEGLE